MIKLSHIFSDPKLGNWLMLSGTRQMVEIRVTKGGRLRVGRPKKATAPFAPDTAGTSAVPSAK